MASRFPEDADMDPGRELVNPCPICWQEHPLWRCIRFLDKKHSERIIFCCENNICRVCLTPGHRTDSCILYGVETCGARGCQTKNHHILLHCDEPTQTSLELVDLEVREEPAVVTRGFETQELADAFLQMHVVPEDLPARLRDPSRSRDTPRSAREAECIREAERISRLCPLCKEAIHPLDNCVYFCSFSLNEREQYLRTQGCSLCLSPLHRISHCRHGNILCGIGRCTLVHHPLLHRLPIEEGSIEYNNSRHRQAEIDNRYMRIFCLVCQQDHDTRKCQVWTAAGTNKTFVAEKHWICIRCFGAAHDAAKCPAREIICGLDRCVEHHDPTFHPYPAETQVGNGRKILQDNYKIQKELEHREGGFRSYTQDVLTQVLTPSPSLMNRMTRGTENVPPLDIETMEGGYVRMPRDDFLRMAKTYFNMAKMARSIAVNMLQDMIRWLPDAGRDTLLAEELLLARNDPQRITSVEQGQQEPLNSYLVRWVLRQASLEHYPPNLAQADADREEENEEQKPISRAPRKH